MKNRSFKILGVPWRLIYVEGPIERNNEGTIYGETDFEKRTIKVSTTDYKGKPRLEVEIEQCLFHEIMHCIFGEGQYKSCNDNEPLVDWCGKILLSLRDQKLI